ncbi:thermonuclease family protein [Microbacterium sp. T2.11-28]|uniref:thermonuclease family protein n=1 Tax=Microbacterium sp. T2.11-28 TaxID=3041169 RepID=UPI0024775C1F|nr:thermonuclease family protein [Microbacterium sp. T2.11-28]CAI9390438.1 Thermonuclease [Microbacterium sp. T2.11-28]
MRRATTGRRRARLVVAVIAALIVAAAVVIAVWVGAGVVPTLPGSEGGSYSPASEAPERPGDAFALTVDDVVDGDTLRATVVAPNEVVTTREQIRIRLIGIDTPEVTPPVECGADAATDHLRELLPEGARVWASVDRDSSDRYERRLFYLWTDDGVFANLDLVAAGHAEAMPVRPNLRHADLFAAAEEQARASGRGRWGSC